MKIAEMRTTVVGTPWRELTFVELITDEGITGVGEVRMLNKTDTLLAALGELGNRYVLGRDPFDVEMLGWQIQRGEYGRAGEVTMSALSAFDIACWDIIGQSLGVPVWRLLGGRVHEKIRAYANGWYQTDRDPSAFAELACTVVARGYTAMKLDPFGAASSELSAAESRTSVGIVEAVREAVGPDVQLMIEMHGRFSPATAARLAVAMEPYEPEWLEEPIPPENAAATAQVRHATTLPIAAGERIHSLHDARELVECGHVDIVQADITHFGGFLPLKRLAGWADVHYQLVAPHNVCGPVGTAANLHFAVGTPNFKVLEHFNDFADSWVHELVDSSPVVDRDGYFSVSERPGLGVRLNHDACAEHPRTGAELRLFKSGWERRQSEMVSVET